MADGISAVDIGMLLFDVEPNETPPARGAAVAARSRPRARLSRAAATGFVGTLGRFWRWLRRALRRSGAARRSGRRPRRALGGDLEPGPPGAEGAVQHRDRPDRSFCWSTFDLADFKRIKNALGGTVNDVSLAVAAAPPPCVAGCWSRGQRWRISSLGAGPGLGPTENEHGELGNKLTAMRGPLPVGVADPVERLRTSPPRWTRSGPPSSRSARKRSGASTTGSATSPRRSCSTRPRRSTSRPGSSTCWSPTSPARRSPSTCSAAS